jgi:hypothetical protein
MKRSSIKTIYPLTLIATGALLFTGCSTSEDLSPESVRNDMSPELESIARTSDLRENDNARAVDTTFRELNDDFDRFWFIDEPSKLSQYPIP